MPRHLVADQPDEPRPGLDDLFGPVDRRQRPGRAPVDVRLDDLHVADRPVQVEHADLGAAGDERERRLLQLHFGEEVTAPVLALRDPVLLAGLVRHGEQIPMFGHRWTHGHLRQDDVSVTATRSVEPRCSTDYESHPWDWIDGHHLCTDCGLIDLAGDRMMAELALRLAPTVIVRTTRRRAGQPG